MLCDLSSIDNNIPGKIPTECSWSSPKWLLVEKRGGTGRWDSWRRRYQVLEHKDSQDPEPLHDISVPCVPRKFAVKFEGGEGAVL